MINKEEFDKYMNDNLFMNLNDAIYNYLLEKIISAELQPGTNLSESNIANDLNVSRTPVKYALDKLSNQLLIHKSAKRIYTVSRMRKTDAKLLYEARIAIEGYAAYLAATRISEDELRQLEELIVKYKSTTGSDSAHCDHEFHEIIINASRNNLIIQMYKGIENSLIHYRNCLYSEIDSEQLTKVLSNAVKYHEAIYNALRFSFSDVAQSEIERDISGMKEIFSEWH